MAGLREADPDPERLPRQEATRKFLDEYTDLLRDALKTANIQVR